MKEEKMRLQSRNESGGGAAAIQTTTNTNDDTDAMREQLEEQQRIAANKERLRKKLSARTREKEIEEDDARLDPNAEKLPDGGFFGRGTSGQIFGLVRFQHAFVADVARTFGELHRGGRRTRPRRERWSSGKVVAARGKTFGWRRPREGGGGRRRRRRR